MREKGLRKYSTGELVLNNDAFFESHGATLSAVPLMYDLSREVTSIVHLFSPGGHVSIERKTVLCNYEVNY